jgi:hypothetical protein
MPKFGENPPVPEDVEENPERPVIVPKPKVSSEELVDDMREQFNSSLQQHLREKRVVPKEAPKDSQMGTPLQQHLSEKGAVPKEAPKDSQMGTPLQQHLSEKGAVPKPKVSAEELADEVRKRIQGI